MAVTGQIVGPQRRSDQAVGRYVARHAAPRSSNPPTIDPEYRRQKGDGQELAGGLGQIGQPRDRTGSDPKLLSHEAPHGQAPGQERQADQQRLAQNVGGFVGKGLVDAQ